MLRLKILASVLALALILPAAAFAQVDTGSANFARYVALGDSLTAGFMSGGLVETAQQFSYPFLIHRQATGNSSGFQQPLISEPGIPAVLVLQSLSPVLVVPKSSQIGTLRNPLGTRPYDNLGIPGARVHDLVATVSGGIYDAVLQTFSPALRGRTALQQALLLQPTFVTLWIGNNDVLAAATSGRVIEGVTLTPVAQFEADYRTIVNAINGAGAKLAIANVPDVASIPFVTTIPPVVVNPQTNQPVIVGGAPVFLIGPQGPLGPNDRVLLSAARELARGTGIPRQLGGSGAPLGDELVLSAGEIAALNARVAAYNAIIRSEASRVGAAFVDVNAIFRELADRGVNVGGVTFTESFLTGGIFSYDGVHPTPFGYAYTANLFLDAINDQFDGEIPLVDLYPFMFGTGATAAAVEASETEGVYGLSQSALRNLFWALNVDNAQGTKQLKPRRKGRK
jgi:lysophospholipase L1-like esterase